MCGKTLDGITKKETMPENFPGVGELNSAAIALPPPVCGEFFLAYHFHRLGPYSISLSRQGIVFQNAQGGGGMWIFYQHSQFTFRGLGWRPPWHIEYVFRVPMFFFYVFFVICVYFSLIQVPTLSIHPSVNPRKFISLSKTFCGQFFVQRNIHGKSPKAASFVNFNVTSNIITGNSVNRACVLT